MAGCSCMYLLPSDGKVRPLDAGQPGVVLAVVGGEEARWGVLDDRWVAEVVVWEVISDYDLRTPADAVVVAHGGPDSVGWSASAVDDEEAAVARWDAVGGVSPEV